MPSRTWLKCSPIVLSVVIATASQVSAQDSQPVSMRPEPEGVATPVSMGLFLIDIAEIDDFAQTFKADVVATLTWQDPRLALPPDAQDRSDRVVPLSDIWNPGLTLINRRDVRIFASDVARIAQDGRVTFEARRFAELSSPLTLHEFPFDTQELRIDIASTRYGPDEVELSLDRGTTGRLEPFSIAGWEVELGEVKISDIDSKGSKKRVRFVQSLTARRESAFFVMKVILPVSLIVFMASTVFWINPENIGPQLGVSTASVLTLIAFQFSLVGMLPRVSYMTRVDLFLLGATVLVFLALGEAVLTSRFARTERAPKAQRIDRHAKWTYALLFVLLLVSTLIV